MKQFICALAVILAACGGRETVASKSAEAFEKAGYKAPAAPEHAATTGAAAEHDHAAHGTTTDHAAHAMTTDHGAHAATTDHSAHASSSAATDHSAHGAAAGRQADPHAGHAMPAQTGVSAATRDPHAGHAMPAQTGVSAATADPHAGHAMPARAGVSAPTLVAPKTSSEMAAVKSGATLQPDAFDAPARSAIAEAAKAAGGAHDEHGQHDGAAVYTCPMHPEVVSATPGTCPKCGMALVKKDQQ